MLEYPSPHPAKPARQHLPAKFAKISHIKEDVGTIVKGIDLAQPIDAAILKRLDDTVVEKVMLMIRGQAHLAHAQLQSACELIEDQNRRDLLDEFPLLNALERFLQIQQGPRHESWQERDLAY
ncbi:MAG: hypothetical protein JXQ99_02360 [Hyphomicrobiaceae bacterium]